MNDKPSILIVDDSEINRELLVSILEDKYNCYQAGDGNEAVRFFEEGKRNVRLVLLDLVMPEADGYFVLDYMKKNELLEDIPVIVVTGDAANDTVIKSYSYGAVDYFMKPIVPEIVNKRVENVIDLYRQKRLDSLTGGYTRNSFIREVEGFLKQVDSPEDYAIIFFNIKNFKAINELFGVSGGDSILKRFYTELADSILKPIYVARLQADHFVCLVRGDDIDFELISNRMERNIMLKGKRIRLFARFGVYYIEDRNMEVSSMIDKAILAKKSLVDEFVRPYAVYHKDMQKEYVDRAEALSEFEYGIENGDFQVYYQPVIEAATGKLASAEALVRWIHPEKGFMPPGAFIPALETNGHITKLDRYMLDNVIYRKNNRIKDGKITIPISVNLSWMDFYDDSMITYILELLEKKEIAKDSIRLEVTETSYATLEQKRENVLDTLRDNGAVVLLDDFGSGYSSFGMLENYNFDILKIDMSFIRKIQNNDKSRIIVQTLIELCHRMGIKTVAEGVETKEQVEFLTENKCDYLQGYYFSKPIPGDEFAEFVARYEAEDKIVIY